MAIAAAALRKRESLARDVERELKECYETCNAAAARGDAGGDVALEGCSWGMIEDDDAMSGCEDNMFACADEPCNVHSPASIFAPWLSCLVCLSLFSHACALHCTPQTSPAVVAVSIQLCDFAAQGLALCCGTPSTFRLLCFLPLPPVPLVLHMRAQSD